MSGPLVKIRSLLSLMDSRFGLMWPSRQFEEVDGRVISVDPSRLFHSHMCILSTLITAHGNPAIGEIYSHY